MFLNNIISWGMVAMLSSLTMTTGSVDRNSTLSQNNSTAPVEEVTEGCSTHFGNQSLIPFHFNPSVSPTKIEIEKITNWLPGTNPSHDCDNIDNLACMIFVQAEYVDDLENPTQLIADPGLTGFAPTGNTYVSSLSSGNQFTNRSN